jgi:hypothetical protein
MQYRIAVRSLLFVFGAAASSFGTSLYSATPIQTAVAASSYSLVYDDDNSIEFETTNKPNDTTKSPAQSDPSAGQRKSLGKAILYSALLPGAGEWYVGHKTKAKYFMAAEAGIWIGFTSFVIYKNWKREDMIQYANQHANAQLEGRDDEFLDLVGFYESIDEYNTLGRATDPQRPFLADTPENHWRWDSEGSIEAFKYIKNSYRESKRRSQFMLGLAVVNRVISIVDAIRDVKRHNAGIGQEKSEFSKADSYKLQFSIHPESDTQVRLTLLTPF